MVKVLMLGMDDTIVDMLRLVPDPVGRDAKLLWREVDPALIPLEPKSGLPAAKRLSCGLLAPSGKYYECDYYGHLKLSEEILVLNPLLRGVRTNPEEMLREYGWVKVSGEYRRDFAMPESRLTPQQIEFLLTNRNNFALTYQLQILAEADGQWR